MQTKKNQEFQVQKFAKKATQGFTFIWVEKKGSKSPGDIQVGPERVSYTHPTEQMRPEAWRGP